MNRVFLTIFSVIIAIMLTQIQISKSNRSRKGIKSRVKKNKNKSAKKDINAGICSNN